MTELDVSTVSLQSNVYPVVDEVPYYDKAFLDAIHDPELLQIFNDRFKGLYHLSPLQNEERVYAIHCMYAEKDDFPWGTIVTDAGEKVVCKCENYGCRLFGECRPGVEAPEAKELEESPDDAPFTEKLPDEGVTIPGMEAFNKAFYEDLEVAPQRIEGKEREEAAEGNYQVIEPEQDAGDFDFDFDLDEFPWEAENEQEEAEQEEQDEDSDAPSFEEIDEGQAYEDSAPTEEQLRVITLPADARAVVNAGPGTGKTFTLIEKLKYMLENQEVPAENILVLSFSRAAVNVIEDRLSAAVSDGQLTAPWQSLDIRTFDKFATWILYRGADLEPDGVSEPFLPSTEEIPQLNYDQRILAARNLIANWEGLFDNVSHVFVDETQDLVSPRADLVLAILNSLPEDCGFTLLGDSCQAIYDYGLYSYERGKRVKKGTTSTDMLNSIRDSFNPVELSLTVNHRAKGSLPHSLEILRAALIDEDVQATRKSIQEIIELYKDDLREIRELDRKTIEAVSVNGTLGILTRTNGEALYVSSLLRNKSISHHLRQADRDEFVSRVIADVFYEYDSDSIDKQEFVSRAIAVGAGTEEECIEGWYELAEACRGKELGARYLVEDLLQCLTSNAKRSAFFTSIPDGNGIAIGTIHSAKGREYDTVWLASNDLAKIAKSADLDECKVAYVALSRSVNSLELKQFEMASRIMGFGDWATGKRRHFGVPRNVAMGVSRTRKKRVSNVEPINEIDVDFKSFGSKSAIQNALRELCEPGSPLSLVKNPASEGIYPTYTICLESDEGQRPLGLLKSSFARGFAIALSAINGGKKRGYEPAEYIDDCPEAFDDLYVEDVVSCIGSAANAPEHAKRFGNQCVWYGVTVTGLAKANSHSY